MKTLKIAITATLAAFALNVYADSHKTNRVPLLDNNKVKVWRTTIYPSKKQQLTMHHHEHDRVLIAFDNGTLKVVNDKGKAHYLKLKKEKAYFLKKDVAGEKHTDVNTGKHPIKVAVIELK